MRAPDGPSTLRDLVEGLARHGDRPALVQVRDGKGEALSYAAIGARALALAGALAARGVKPGETVLLFGPNGHDWVVVRLALGALGAITAALDDLTTDDELKVLVPDSGARLAFSAAAHAKRLAAVDPTLALVTLDPGEGLPRWTDWEAGEKAELPPIRPEDPMMLVTTSGTTGRPKSFLLTHANVLHNVRALAAQGIVTREDRALLPLPLHHVYPLTVGILTPFALGTTVVLPESVTGPHIVAALKEGRCTVMVAVPRLYAALLNGLMARVAQQPAPRRLIFRALFALSMVLRRRFGLRVGRRLFGSIHRNLAPDLWLMASGGAAFEAELIWPLEALGWQVLSGWGLAETASILTNNHKDKARIGSEGWPLPGAELRVAEPDEKGVGELQCRGPSVFAGYRDNPEANETAFTPDGWFRTGDLGFIDPDRYVHIVGRVKEMIVLGGGKNVFPEELEKHYGADPAIKEIAVLERSGALVALVVPDEPAIAASGSPRIDDAVRVALGTAAQRLPSYQRLAGYAITREPLPRTRLGKIQRFRLPALYDAAKAGRSASAAPMTEEERALLADPTARAMWEVLTARFQGKLVAPSQSPQLDLGIDSLGWVEITLEAEGRLGLRFSEDDWGTIATVRDILELAVKRAAEGAPARAAEPPDLSWLEPPSGAHAVAGKVLAAANRVLCAALFRLRVRGREHVPDGPVIVAVNHLSDIDPAIMAAALPKAALARIRWSGERSRLFVSRIGRFLARAARIFPVDERQPATTLAYAKEALARGDCLVWFPESWRSPDGTIQRFLPGVGELVRATGAAVVPARIIGTFEAMPRTARFPKPHPVRVAFGAPIPAATLIEGAASAQEIADRVREAVARLEP
ncbi:AMP-binding protein [Elioraea tepidiphila]|uniref:AMP-binding protein n=1 Tax=Elioraea tepidiphila TaxID=457934 RepID=UPI0003633874|nr:AMP-binding protein [Elioraea tepidiphila]